MHLLSNTADLNTHARAHTRITYTGRAAARLSSPKIIRHQNEFPCFFFFFLPLFVLFMYWNSGDWLLRLTCSHHEFSLHHYMGTLQEQGSCDYRDAINMQTLTETHTHAEISDTHKPHAFIQINECVLTEILHYSALQCVSSYVASENATA